MTWLCCPWGIPCVLCVSPSVGLCSVAGVGQLCSVSPWQQLCLLRGCPLLSDPDKAAAGGRREKKEERDGLPKRRQLIFNYTKSSAAHLHLRSPLTSWKCCCWEGERLLKYCFSFSLNIPHSLLEVLLTWPWREILISLPWSSTCGSYFFSPFQNFLGWSRTWPLLRSGSALLDLFFDSKNFSYQKIFSGQHIYLQTGIIING